MPTVSKTAKLYQPGYGGMPHGAFDVIGRDGTSILFFRCFMALPIHTATDATALPSRAAVHIVTWLSRRSKVL